MEVRERLIDIDEFWRFICDADDDRRYELIEGEIIEMPLPGKRHGHFAGEFYHYFRLFDPNYELGMPTVESGYYSADDRYTLLGPDAAFTLNKREGPALHDGWEARMPDIAVEVRSPSNTMAELRRKAALYLRGGSSLVWIVMPETKSVEVWRLGLDGEIESETIDQDGALTGEDVLPGFELRLSQLFALQL